MTRLEILTQLKPECEIHQRGMLRFEKMQTMSVSAIATAKMTEIIQAW